MNVAGAVGLPADGSVTLTVTPGQQQALWWAIDAALDDQAYYLKNADPDVDHGDEWPEVAAAKAIHLDNLAVTCEELRGFRAADACRELASAFREAVGVESEGGDL
jgi:hypothetical protein